MRTLFLLLVLFPAALESQGGIAFLGLHGGVFPQLQELATPLRLHLRYVTDRDLQRGRLGRPALLVVQHLRREARRRTTRVLLAALAKDPRLRILDLTGNLGRLAPTLARHPQVLRDRRARAYYRNPTRENLRRFLLYLAIRYLGRPGEVPPPEEGATFGLYHPERRGLFPDAAAYRKWAAARRGQATAPLVVVAVHWIHLQVQQPRVVEALIRGLEAEGLRAVAVVDSDRERYRKTLLALRPQVVVHTCHSFEDPAFREQLGAVHVQSLFFRKQSIGEWEKSPIGLAPNEMFFQVAGQELLGTIEPLTAAGTRLGGGSAEAFTPLPERIRHLARRVRAWVRLATLPNREKRVAIVYYDREMGKAELMRGSATGMFLNGPRSLLRVLRRLKQAGYRVDPLPRDEQELLQWLMERGRQIGVWAPATLARLVAAGDPALVAEERYRRWFAARVPPAKRAEVIRKWGPPPGRFLVWRRADGKRFLVIPKVRLGNVLLLPQPLRGEAHDTSRAHDKRSPPPHNYLATYFWLEEVFRAHAVVHFGTHGTEFLLPGKDVGLGPGDWPDILLGELPNINPWILNNVGESSPVRRRAYAVLVDHLTPPLVRAELSDELLNLHNEIDKWVTLEEGALKERFRRRITEAVRKLHLDRDLDLSLRGRLLSPAEVRQVARYLHDIHEETTPISLHVLGVPPPEKLRLPYLVRCLRRPFLEALGRVLPVPQEETLLPGDREKYLRRQAEALLQLHLRQGLGAAAALERLGARLPAGRVPKTLAQGLALAVRLDRALDRARDEVENLLRALAGRFVPPGPAMSPDRNPSSVPTGRNMYVLNPEEVPSRPSWDLGRELADRLLQAWHRRHGRYPRKVAFTLSAFATFRDYGVMESQILWLLGVKPVWDRRNRVVDVALVSRKELGRPRVDVFLALGSYYRDLLPTRLRLLDRAIRLVAALDEPGNPVRAAAEKVRAALEAQGVPPARAAQLARARIFGHGLGYRGSAGYYYLVERSGDWDTRADLMRVYLAHVRHVYTEGLWGVEAPAAYDRHIAGTEVVVRTWADATTSPLSNKYFWYRGGSLALAVKHLTGREPEFFLTDVRDPDRAGMVRAEAALRREYRVRLFNRKWIQGMMREGYAGADQIAVHVANTFGWKIMRPESVTDDIWARIVDIYVRDTKKLGLRAWFERVNPFAFQEVTEILLEAVRKGYWRPDATTLREIAAAYARNVVRHGEGEGLRGGGNEKLRRFVRRTLAAPGLEPLRRAWEARVGGKVVSGRRLAPVRNRPAPRPVPWRLVGAGVAALLLILLGYLSRRGMPKG